MTIELADVIPVLLAATPSFAAPWAAYEAEAEFDRDLLYLHLAEYARHLLTLVERDDASGLRAAFGAVERLHVDGDRAVREAATVCLLETLQNNAKHAGVDPARFRAYLEPASRAAWDAVLAFWERGEPIPDPRGVTACCLTNRCS